VGVTARVDGDVMSTSGDVRLVRQSTVLGDVYADGEFRGDRDIHVGQPGSHVEVRGDAIIRDRSEYFAAIMYEGTMSVLGVGAPVFHASVTQMSPGTLASPSLPAWKLGTLSLGSASPSSTSVTVTKDMGPTALTPGRYGSLSIGQEGIVVLSPGVYDFDQVLAQSDARLQMLLPAATDTITLRVRRDVKPGRRFAMDVMTNDAALRRSRASRITTITGGSFRGDQDVVWAGAIPVREGRVFRQAHDLPWCCVEQGQHVRLPRLRARVGAAPGGLTPRTIPRSARIAGSLARSSSWRQGTILLMVSHAARLPCHG
jgi:hypothetical protein